ncbi:MAG: iron-sulfur cluster assembly accessory protein [Thaumarchaeota archaeon]|nr:iron-sulfur cluster assembly accessory protein [Nitrososphaerota archaeon]
MQKLQPLVTITPAAATKLSEVLKQEGASDSYLRVEVYETGGCACSGGFKYALSLEKEPRSTDVVEEVGGLRVMIEQKNENMVRGSKIDYYETLQRTGFKIENPNVHVEACGCGGH